MCNDNKLSGEVVPTVALDGTSVLVCFVWPEFFTDLNLVQLGLENEGMARATMLNLVMAGKKELNELRKGLGRSKHQPLCASTVIPLKHEVETSIKKFVPLYDNDSYGMCLLIILKVKEAEVVELDKKDYDFRYVDKKRKKFLEEEKGLW
jgi:hypothetical protein